MFSTVTSSDLREHIKEHLIQNPALLTRGLLVPGSHPSFQIIEPVATLVVAKHHAEGDTTGCSTV